MKIGLMGFEFNSPNKGCEALTYSFISILNDLDNVDEKITLINYSGTDLGIIPNEFPKFKFIDKKPKLKDFKFKYIKSLKECDMIFDVTMGDSFSDIYSKKYFNSLMIHKRIAEICCSNYILLPQTYGPFNSNKSEKRAKKVLKKANKIYCRDQLSKVLLENKLNIKNVELASDMAFILPYEKEKYVLNNKKKKIGINISGLLYKGGFNKENQFDLKLDYKEYIEKIIEYFLKIEEYEVHLIPHVIDLAEDSYDDDYKTCAKLKQKFNKCILAPAFNTPIEAKSYIANMDFFIGSRMHSTIAAFSSNVATIPVSYSRKFEGLYSSLNYEYVINGKKENVDSAFEKTIYYINKKDEIQKKQKSSLDIIKEKNDEFIFSIHTLFNNFEKRKEKYSV